MLGMDNQNQPIRSWRLAAASVVAIPVIGAGALMATLLTDGALSLASLVGFAAILGIAIQHGLALVMHFERLERLGSERARHVLVLDGLRERTPAILVTYVAIAAFFLPFTLLEGSAGLELAYPAAVAAIGSLLATRFRSLAAPRPGQYVGADRPAAHRFVNGTCGKARSSCATGVCTIAQSNRSRVMGSFD